MDFIDGLPPSAGKKSIFVMVDRLSKYAHFSALSHPYREAIVTKDFVRDVAKLHGMPRTIVSDQDQGRVLSVTGKFFVPQLCLSSCFSCLMPKMET